MAAGQPLRFDRHELAGAFGDLGTDLPLLVGLVLACGLDAASVLTVFGALQIATALAYRMPMPVQPLKAMAAVAIAQRLPASTLAAGGLWVGGLMLLLSLSGGLAALGRAVPKTVVRGVQLGLGLQLASLAAREFLPALGAPGWVLAGVSACLVIALLDSRKLPPGLLVVGLGLAYALATTLEPSALAAGFGLRLPSPALPPREALLPGLLLLALPQLPLSLANSVLATRQVSNDLFPDRVPGVRKIGLTYAAMNLLAPIIGGVPVCHGSGGMAGHYAFGGRTGGSVAIYGAVFLVAGLFFGGAFAHAAAAFPKPTLGVLLAFEGLAMMGLSRDEAGDREGYALVLLLGLVAAFTPYGYLTALAAGTVLHRFKHRLALRSLK